MQVNNIISGLSNAAALGNRNSTAAPGGQPGAATTTSVAPSGSTASNAALQSILSQYDVTNISPNEFSQMLQKLAAAGAVSPQELQQLSGVRGDLTAAGVEPDEATNLLDFYSKKIQNTQQHTDDADAATQQQQLSPLLGRLGWLEKINSLKTQPDGAGLSALA